MTDSLYTSRSHLEVLGPLHRRAHLEVEAGAGVDFGVHGAIRELFLDVRQVNLPNDAISADAEGLHELRDGLPVLTEIRVQYRLRIPSGTRETVDRALARHQEKCPTAASLKGAVAIHWTAEIDEAR